MLYIPLDSLCLVGAPVELVLFCLFVCLFVQYFESHLYILPIHTKFSWFHCLILLPTSIRNTEIFKALNSAQIPVYSDHSVYMFYLPWWICGTILFSPVYNPINNSRLGPEGGKRTFQIFIQLQWVCVMTLVYLEGIGPGSLYSVSQDMDIPGASWPYNKCFIERKYIDTSPELCLTVWERLWDLEVKTSILMQAVRDCSLPERSQLEGGMSNTCWEWHGWKCSCLFTPSTARRDKEL